jgi:hypothetical protein
MCCVCVLLLLLLLCVVCVYFRYISVEVLREASGYTMLYYSRSYTAGRELETLFLLLIAPLLFLLDIYYIEVLFRLEKTAGIARHSISRVWHQFYIYNVYIRVI